MLILISIPKVILIYEKRTRPKFDNTLNVNSDHKLVFIFSLSKFLSIDENLSLKNIFLLYHNSGQKIWKVCSIHLRERYCLLRFRSSVLIVLEKMWIPHTWNFGKTFIWPMVLQVFNLQILPGHTWGFCNIVL